MADKDLLTEVNITELLKIAKQSDIQYNAVVKQNRELQAELREVQNENFLLKDAFETYKKEKFELEVESEELKEENDKLESDAIKYYRALRDVSKIAEKIAGDYDGNQADKMIEDAEEIIKMVREVCNVDND